MSEPVMFIDPMAPRPYDRLSDMRGLGGTEATLLQAAFGLAGDRRVAVAQTARQQDALSGGVRFLPWPVDTVGATTLVVINSWKLALKLRRRRPDARVALWLHVFPGRHNRRMGQALAEADIDIIAVSHSHADWLRAYFPGAAAPRLHVIYNPVADDLVPDDTPRDPDLLLFASAPHKGLDQVLQRFLSLRPHFPQLRLEIADPGYLAWPVPQDLRDGLVWLGTLDQQRLIRHYRKALCLFMPQTGFRETFGLVIAEANAVGCPALLQKGLGANDEVAGAGSALIDVTDSAQLVSTLRSWRERPPTCRGKPQFRRSAVIRAWRDWLDANASAARQSAPVMAPRRRAGGTT